MITARETAEARDAAEAREAREARDIADTRVPREVVALTPDDDPTTVQVQDGTLRVYLNDANGIPLDVDARNRAFFYIVGGIRYVQSGVETNDHGDQVWVYRSDLYAKR